MAIKELALDVVLPLIYRIKSLKPVEKGSVLFLDTTRPHGIDPCFQLVYDRLSSDNSLHVRTATTAAWHGALDTLVGYSRLTKRIARTETVFLRDGSSLVSCLPLRKETKVIQLWHGCGAFKKFGMSTAEMRFGPTREEREEHGSYKNLSLVTVSAPEVVDIYVEAMSLENRAEIVKPLGVSRTDVFFDEERLASARKKLLEIAPGIGDRKVILYAPTFRGETKKAVAPVALDIPLMREQLGDEYALVIKYHPIIANIPDPPAGCEGFAFVAPTLSSVNDLMMAADICVTDYSSLVFEWSLLNRPIAFFAFDLEEYLDDRGFYYDYETMTPGPVCATNEELVSFVRSLDNGFDTGEITAFRERFMSACDGHATDRIIETVFGTKGAQ